MKNNTIAIIQARMGSSRMKGKSLISLNGRPLILHVVNSVQKLDFVNQTIVATTTLEEDDPIVTLCKANNIKFYRGDALNVFKRFIDASSSFQENDTIVRITADNPLNWINITKKLFEIHKNNNNDYTCIHGLSHIVSEFIKVGALRDLDNRFELTKFDKEHVTPFFRKNKSFFKVEMLDPDFMGLRQDLDNFLTLDVFEDFLRFEKIFEKKLNNNFIKLYSWLEKNENKTNSKKKEETVTVNLFGTPVGENYPIYIIAEIGQNHNGDMIMAKKLIDIAVKTGANAVKFQKRDIPSELTKEAFYKPYDNPNSFGKTYGEHRVFLELNEAQHKELKEYANIKGITYFCTPCDVSSVELLERIDCPFYKVASRDLTNIPLLEKLAKTNKPIIISTGMADEEDIKDALNTLNLDKDHLIIMHCTSEYPCKPENVNLSAIKTLNKTYGFITGLSDHTSGIITSSVASAIGANVIEKHITLNRTLKGTDQPGSLEEYGLKKLVEYIRTIEESMGDGVIKFNPAVKSSKIKLARSITSKIDIKKNDVITEEMICLKSPGDGLLWRNKNEILGKKAMQHIDKDVTLKKEFFT